VVKFKNYSMQKSMTGFGKGNCEVGGKNLTIEIRTLNSKSLDLNIKVPNLYRDKEIIIRNELSTKLERGKIDFSIHIDYPKVEKGNVINKEIVRNYIDQLNEIANENMIPKNDLLSLAINLPDVLKSEVKELDESEWDEVFNVVKKTIAETNGFRIQEGKVLINDLLERIEIIKKLLLEIEPFEIERITKIKKKIKENLFDVVSKENIDSNRLEQELIFYIEKVDITEEKTRLKNHCSYFVDTAQNEVCAGKKLGFISQEIGREINTIGSKANDFNIQKKVVQMKDELEKIKEQLLNIL
jgi:uncharacterized protein (TIGR00255 family)